MSDIHFSTRNNYFFYFSPLVPTETHLIKIGQFSVKKKIYTMNREHCETFFMNRNLIYYFEIFILYARSAIQF